MSSVGVVLLSFGEPEGTDPADVVDFLERIFLANKRLEPGSGARRARQLAEARAPALLETYRGIGGSPMNAHTRGHARALESELHARGHAAHVFVGTQFATPTISDALARCREAGVDRVVALPLYPISGPTTTLAALDSVRDEVGRMSWPVDATFIGGWHRHPDYVELRVDGIRSLMSDRGLDPDDPGLTLYFSAHGTPISYLREGSRYREYVEDSCRSITRAAGIDAYALGYQNHTNRGVAWTEPSNETLMASIDATDVVVVPVSFIHEQSETLHELDFDLKNMAEARGVAFHRVATPFEHPAMAGVLADLVLEALNRRDDGLMAQCGCQGLDHGLCASSPAQMSVGS